jgi:hypothetical protein
MFIVVAVGWVLDVSLPEQLKLVLYMLIMFMDVAIWWDLDVSLSEQETSAMLIMFMVAMQAAADVHSAASSASLQRPKRRGGQAT